MASGSSRRRVLAGFAAAFAAGIGAGCSGADQPELRVRNFGETARTLDVEVTRDDGETVHAAEYRLDPDEQATTQEIFDYAGTYVVTASLDGVATSDGGTTATSEGETTANPDEDTTSNPVEDTTVTDEIDVDDPDGTLTHVTVRDDGLAIGRIAP